MVLIGILIGVTMSFLVIVSSRIAIAECLNANTRTAALGFLLYVCYPSTTSVLLHHISALDIARDCKVTGN